MGVLPTIHLVSFCQHLWKDVGGTLPEHSELLADIFGKSIRASAGSGLMVECLKT